MAVMARHDDRVVSVKGQATLPRLFRHVVGTRGEQIAMREKRLGIWRSISWREYGDKARRVGLGLVALGLRPKDVVSIIADNGPEGLYTRLGTMSAGGVTIGIYRTYSARESAEDRNDIVNRFCLA